MMSQYRDGPELCQPVILTKVNNWLDTLLPRQCVLCGQESGDRNTCGGCRDDLPWIWHGCRHCGGPLPPDCGSDLTADRVVSALIYEYPVDRLIAAAKFYGRPEIASALGELLGHWLLRRREAARLDLPDILVPVPLHRRRLAHRGFNQALEIVHPVARMLGLPVERGACQRVRDTVEQTTLTGRARRRNVRDAFRADPRVANLCVAMVDDVLTTGSTLAALGAALRAAGARSVQAWSVARSVPTSGDAQMVRKL